MVVIKGGFSFKLLSFYNVNNILNSKYSWEEGAGRDAIGDVMEQDPCPAEPGSVHPIGLVRPERMGGRLFSKASVAD